MNHEKALEAARLSGGIVDERAITAYLAAYGVKDLGALLEDVRVICEKVDGLEAKISACLEASLSVALTAALQE